ncbi:MAG TPA: O-antigen ligase family protein [Solirubrobacteraceae bacterium]|nr:O-antigen ligase family protein [Solirubrobacteraceae bacterium]
MREARRAGDFDASAALTFGVAWLISLPSAAVAFSASLIYRADVFRNLIKTYPGWYTTLTHICLAVVAVLVVVLLLRRPPSRGVPIHAAGLLALALWGVAQLGAALHGGSSPSIRAGLLVLCLLAATVLPRGRGAALGAGLYGVTLAIAGCILALVHYKVALVVPCRGACSLLGFQGVLPNEDLLGIALAASIPFAFLGFRGPSRYWLSMLLGVAVVATGSHTATVAAGISVILVLLLRPELEEAGGIARAAIAGLFLVAVVIGSAAIVLKHWGPTALSDRGQLWSVASHYISRSAWVGYGPDRWSTLYASGQIPLSGQRSAHNLWMDVLFASGWIGVLLLVAMVSAMLRSAGRGRLGVIIALTTILVLGTAEGTWQVGNLDSMSFSLLALILMGATGRGETRFPEVERHIARPYGPPRTRDVVPVASAPLDR